MKGHGTSLLEISFRYLREQVYKDFDVVVSDHSQDNSIRDLCEKEKILKVSYHRNTINRGSSSANLNNSMSLAEGDVIKILFQDDIIRDINCLQQIADAFEDKSVNWALNSCAHTRSRSLEMPDLFQAMRPRYHEEIYMGVNTISSPSVLSVRNLEELPKFDDRLLWLMDVDYYKSLKDMYGLPTIVEDEYPIVNRLWDGRVSSTITPELIALEEGIVRDKYK
jgi:glycosyltransferase involved in cell wall biosynthesis